MERRRRSKRRVRFDEGFSTIDLDEAIARSLEDHHSSGDNAQHQQQQQSEVPKEKLSGWQNSRGRRRKRGQSIQEETEPNDGEPEADQTERKNEECESEPPDSKKRKTTQDAEAARKKPVAWTVTPNKSCRKRRKKDVVRKHFGYTERQDNEDQEVYVLDSSDEVSPEEERVMRDDRIFAYPSRGHCDAVMFGPEDVNCLNETNYINDVVVALYIKHILPTPRHKIHVFDSFFYPVLSAVVCRESPDLERLRNWLKGVDIFEKTYVLIPVHHKSHWSLAMMCFSEPKPGCHILHFDSMKIGHASGIVYEVFRRYLMAEWTARGGAKADLRKTRVRRVKVPKQKNDYDCGIFMLHFLEKVLSNAPPVFSEDMLNKMFDWFSLVEASELRAKFRNVLQGVLRDQEDKSEEQAVENPQPQAASEAQLTAEKPGVESQHKTI